MEQGTEATSSINHLSPGVDWRRERKLFVIAGVVADANGCIGWSSTLVPNFSKARATEPMHTRFQGCTNNEISDWTLRDRGRPLQLSGATASSVSSSSASEASVSGSSTSVSATGSRRSGPSSLDRSLRSLLELQPVSLETEPDRGMDDSLDSGRRGGTGGAACALICCWISSVLQTVSSGRRGRVRASHERWWCVREFFWNAWIEFANGLKTAFSLSLNTAVAIRSLVVSTENTGNLILEGAGSLSSVKLTVGVTAELWLKLLIRSHTRSLTSPFLAKVGVVAMSSCFDPYAHDALRRFKIDGNMLRWSSVNELVSIDAALAVFSAAAALGHKGSDGDRVLRLAWVFSGRPTGDSGAGDQGILTGAGELVTVLSGGSIGDKGAGDQGTLTGAGERGTAVSGGPIGDDGAGGHGTLIGAGERGVVDSGGPIGDDGAGGHGTLIGAGELGAVAPRAVLSGGLTGDNGAGDQGTLTGGGGKVRLRGLLVAIGDLGLLGGVAVVLGLLGGVTVVRGLLGGVAIICGLLGDDGSADAFMSDVGLVELGIASSWASEGASLLGETCSSADCKSVINNKGRKRLVAFSATVVGSFSVGVAERELEGVFSSSSSCDTSTCLSDCFLFCSATSVSDSGVSCGVVCAVGWTGPLGSVTWIVCWSSSHSVSVLSDNSAERRERSSSLAFTAGEMSCGSDVKSGSDSGRWHCEPADGK